MSDHVRNETLEPPRRPRPRSTVRTVDRPTWRDHRTRMAGRLLIAATQVASYMPLTLMQSLATGLGQLMDLAGSKYGRVADTNIAACYPQLLPGERKAMRKQVMTQNASLLGELPAVWFRSRRYWAKRLDTSEFDVLAGKLLGRGNGLIIALTHLGNWELGIHGFGAVGGFTAVYRPSRTPALEPLLRKGRERNDVRMAPANRSGVREVCKTLRAGKTVVILPDQSPADERTGAIHAPFFGRPALTMTLLSQLSRRTGAPVIFGCFERGLAGKFTLRCFEADASIASEDPLQAASALNQGVERCVSFRPDQYQWIYKRFNPTPSGESSIYRRCRRSESG